MVVVISLVETKNSEEQRFTCIICVTISSFHSWDSFVYRNLQWRLWSDNDLLLYYVWCTWYIYSLLTKITGSISKSQIFKYRSCLFFLWCTEKCYTSSRSRHLSISWPYWFTNILQSAFWPYVPAIRCRLLWSRPCVVAGLSFWWLRIRKRGVKLSRPEDTSTENTLPTPPCVFFSRTRRERTECPVCQKDISTSYIDRHLRNMHRK